MITQGLLVLLTSLEDNKIIDRSQTVEIILPTKVGFEELKKQLSGLYPEEFNSSHITPFRNLKIACKE